MMIATIKGLGFTPYDIIDVVGRSLLAPESRPYTPRDTYIASDYYQKNAQKYKTNAWEVVYESPVTKKLLVVTWYVKEFVLAKLGLPWNKRDVEFYGQYFDNDIISFIDRAADEIIKAFKEMVTGEKQTFTMWDRTSLTVLMHRLYPETKKFSWDYSAPAPAQTKTAAAAVAAATAPEKDYLKYLPYAAALGLLALAI